MSVMTVIVMTVTCLTGCTNAFKKETVVKTLNKIGVTELKTIEEADKKFGAGSVTRVPDVGEYYVSKNEEEALHLYITYNESGRTRPVQLNEDIVCFGHKISLFMVTAKSEVSARDVYDFWADYIKFDNAKFASGKKNGYEYTISYCWEDGPGDCGYGIYKKGDIVIYADSNSGEDSIYKELGLISPYTLK